MSCWLFPTVLVIMKGQGAAPGIDGPAWGRQQPEGLLGSSLTLPVHRPHAVPFAAACSSGA